jgi:hypothetical protein
MHQGGGRKYTKNKVLKLNLTNRQNICVQLTPIKAMPAVVVHGAVGKTATSPSGGPRLITGPGQTYDWCGKVGSFL